MRSFRRSVFALVLALLPAQNVAAQRPEPATVEIAILTLFNPVKLILTTAAPSPVELDGNDAILLHPLTLYSGMTLRMPETTFTLTLPGKLTRTYRGALTVSTTPRHELLAVVTMPTELAVASIVAAESPPDAPFEALKAQAIASRSYLLANPHAHAGYDACDTTHCQFLRSPPPAGSAALRAAQATRNLVLTWQPSAEGPAHLVAAMYSRSCGGHTRARPTQDPNQYPFYAVACQYCLRHPERWTRKAGAETRTEQQRLAYNRVHGWSALPSNTHWMDTGELHGTGTGHGFGLCQLGAADLAARGFAAGRILAIYFPNTALTQLP